ncbi:TVP38/TMEM64 family protein [Paenibacillus caui]|uniref:TVP38/TMEM64 family protein n=1 Tax=Paenibacillus caui TaxID=2873927 RepID=UPI001CA9999F|nr:VTT domain-containing protein [Paenibacillus caui]
MDDWFQAEQFAEWLRNMGGWAIIASLMLNIVISVLGVIPSVFLSGANAIVFGLVPGFAISLTGEAIGAGISFWLYRQGIQRLSAKKNDTWRWVRRLNGANRTRKFYMLIMARLTPFLPSGIITFAAAATNIAFLDFLLASLIGKAPSVAIETLVGHDLFYVKDNFMRLLISLVLLSLIYCLFRKRVGSSDE